MNVKIGDILVAKDRCEMAVDSPSGKIYALIIGKGYRVVEIEPGWRERVVINSEYRTSHKFSLYVLEKFFYTETELRREKLLKLNEA